MARRLHWIAVKKAIRTWGKAKSRFNANQDQLGEFWSCWHFGTFEEKFRRFNPVDNKQLGEKSFSQALSFSSFLDSFFPLLIDILIREDFSSSSFTGLFSLDPSASCSPSPPSRIVYTERQHFHPHSVAVFSNWTISFKNNWSLLVSNSKLLMRCFK